MFKNEYIKITLIILSITLSFALGYIFAKTVGEENRAPIIIEKQTDF